MRPRGRRTGTNRTDGPDPSRRRPRRICRRLPFVAIDFSAEIERLRHIYASIAAVTDPEALRARIAELSEQASAPDLWDDPDSAQVVTSALSHAQADLRRVESLGERIEDLEAMVELAGEEEGVDAAEILAEAESDLTAISKDLSDLEIRTLLSGEYDPRDAVVTIRSGAGGVDAADFAEMLLRMYTAGPSGTTTPSRSSIPPTPRRRV